MCRIRLSILNADYAKSGNCRLFQQHLPCGDVPLQRHWAKGDTGDGIRIVITDLGQADEPSVASRKKLSDLICQPVTQGANLGVVVSAGAINEVIAPFGLEPNLRERSH